MWKVSPNPQYQIKMETRKTHENATASRSRYYSKRGVPNLGYAYHYWEMISS
jgi:hypothetical protein